ncbi:MAG: PIN domain-containing protein [Ilumatobacteraceae bacterium]
MSRALIDTNIFVARETGRSFDLSKIPDELAVSVVTVAELQLGVLTAGDTATRQRRLITFRDALAFNPIEITVQIADAWASLRLFLRGTKSSLTVNDLWIAATALALGVPLVTQDQGLIGLPNIETILV